MDWRLYSREARRARRRLPRYEHPLLLTAVVSVVITLAGVQLLQAAGVGVGSGIRDAVAVVTNALPKAQEAPLVIGEQQVTVSVAPILDALPDFTKTNSTTVAGRVPTFALGADRRIAVALNGKTAATLAIGSDGRFGPLSLALVDGSNTITATLLDRTTEVAATSHTVVVDHIPPTLSITRPKAGDTVSGNDVIIEGKTEAGAEVTLNDRPLRPNPDGTFTDRLSVPSGALALTIVARDKAGNETKAQIAVTVKDGTQTAAGTALTLTLDRAKVRPGETVVARIVATDGGKAKADVSVTLSVGVFTVGTYKTDASGIAVVGFAAPDHEIEDVGVVVVGGGTSARSTLTVSTK